MASYFLNKAIGFQFRLSKTGIRLALSVFALIKTLCLLLEILISALPTVGQEPPTALTAIKAFSTEVCVFQTAATHAFKPKQAINHAKRLLDLGSDAGLTFSALSGSQRLTGCLATLQLRSSLTPVNFEDEHGELIAATFKRKTCSTDRPQHFAHRFS